MYETPDGGIVLPAPPSAARKVAVGAKHHFTGVLAFGEAEGRAMEVGSHTQMQIALIMLARREAMDLENQVPFRWTDQDGKVRTHFFSFRVSLRDGSRIAITVTNAERARSIGFKEKARRIAAQVTPDVADRACVMTNEHIDPIEAHNATLLHGVRQSDPEADAAARRAIGGMGGAVRIADLVDLIGLGARGFRALARLIRSHELELTNHERISHEALGRRRMS